MTKIKISGCELDMFQVFHSVIRQYQVMPTVGIVKQSKLNKDLFDNGISDLVVREPTPANYMCLFWPCHNAYILQVFEAIPEKFKA